MEIEKLLFRLSKEIVETSIDNPLILGIPNRGDILANRISANLSSFGYQHDLEKINYHPFRDDLVYEIEKTKLLVMTRLHCSYLSARSINNKSDSSFW